MEKINIHRWGFWFGIIIFSVLLVLPTPENLTAAAQRCAAVTLLLAIWWITQALPIPVTALVPLILFPLLKITTIHDVAKLYVNHYIFLFMGGFMIALTIEKWNLHKRIALHILRFLGAHPAKILLGFMLATAYLSLWISNTATVLILFPIALAVSSHLKLNKHSAVFTSSLLLGIAYSASVGGMATPIGTPPNVLFLGMLPNLISNAPEISFFKWMIGMLPLSILLLSVIWGILLQRIKNLPHVNDASGAIESEIQKLPPIGREEKWVGIIFALTALLWMFRQDINVEFLVIPGWSNLLGLADYVSDASVAMLMALILFIIPNRKRTTHLLDWETALKLPWGMLLLFGAGFAIAGGLQASGLSEWIGNVMSQFKGLPPYMYILLVCLMMTFLTEVTSNTATASIILPIIAASTAHLEMNPLLVLLPATLSASCAFMLPVATPPNMIIFGTKRVPIREMIKIGFILNLIGALVISLYAYFILPFIIS